jgi:3-hydroxymyristoyl/3-hydroxydecanoyl-(acyl carrier protein) dehydratase/3-oxoacyl-(acyl-carrier-protein) synthase/malonyl CoA-acyl carrier protein transacylase
MAEVWRDRDLPALGALKANIGHTVTASGAAGILKLLGVFENGLVPSTPSREELNDEFRSHDFRIVEGQEPWRGKFAAVSSFGFGGNNAHLILEAPDEAVEISSTPTAEPSRVAVVGIGVRTHLGRNFPEFEQLLRSDVELPPVTDVELFEEEVAVPPTELAAALPQQLLVLKSASEAMAGLRIPEERTGVYAGMQCDPLAARYVLRARLADMPDDAANLADSLSPPCRSGNVIGCMPNITANRINHLRDLEAASFSVSEEELSGDRSLELAIRALNNGEIDCAIVCAVDMCREEVQRTAMVGPLADAAVAFVLKSEDRARADGDPVVAWIDSAPGSDPDLMLGNTDEDNPLRKRLGHSHAASGLLHLAAGIALVRDRFRPSFESEKLEPLLPGDLVERGLAVANEREGRRRDWFLTIPREGLFSRSIEAPPTVEIHAADSMAELGESVARGSGTPTDGPCRLAIVADAPLSASRRSSLVESLSNGGIPSGDWSDGAIFRSSPVKGDLGFVFTGANAARTDVAANVLDLFPALLGRLEDRACAIWNHGMGSLDLAARDPFNSFSELKSCSLVCQLDAELSRGVLGLEPRAFIGLSSGETNSLVASGTWRDMDQLLDDVDASGLYQVHLDGPYESVRTSWELPDDAPVAWESWLVLADVAEVESALEGESRVYLTIVQSPGSVLIAGDRERCREILSRIGSNRAFPLRSALCCHCSAVGPFADTWKKVHTRAVHEPWVDARIYSNFLGRAYEPSELEPETIADAVTGQASNPVDFPATILRAWNDGVRVFLEHGPDNSLSRAIREILGDRENVAVALHDPSRSTMEQLCRSAAELWTAGVDVDWDRLLRMNRAVEYLSRDPDQAVVTVPATRPPVSFSAEIEDGDFERMPLRPDLLDPAALFSADRVEEPPLREPSRGEPVVARSGPAVRHPVARAHQMAAVQHMEYLRIQQLAFRNLQRINHLVASRLGHGSGPVSLPVLQVEEAPPESLEVRMRNELRRSDPAETALWEWDAMLKLASGKISEVFGSDFEEQDSYEVQVRLPCPPLLLCERILGIDAEPRSMGTGTIWTEHTVTEDKWYLHERRMPPGIFIECGQADLTLISYLGADFLNRGDRVYRLLGCELTWLGALPKPGDTLKYEIRVKGHAKQGDVRLFFFEYECWINGEVRAQVRSGQAGFFTAGELADSGGVVWDPDPEEFTENPRLAPLPLPSRKTSFTRSEVEAWLDGKPWDCFGSEFDAAKPHHRTPRTEKGKLNFIEEVVAFDPVGGPAGRGYVKAVQTIHPDDWFFDGHFHKDPCMPGTLMANGCQQLLSFFLVATGFTLERDGWMFETPQDHTMKFFCRGQVVPGSRELTYEVFVDEIVEEGEVTLIAHVLCTVDGLKAFFADRMAVCLAPAWPADGLPESRWETDDSRPVASIDGFPLDYRSLMNCALGRPSEAFGPAFARYDGAVPPPRLPNPPYHFATRILHLEGSMGAATAGAEMEMLYDIPGDAWYFRDDPGGVMPFCVLMEIALQPCGWLSSYNLDGSTTPTRLLYRNLDGTSEVLRTITPADSAVRTKSRLLSHSQSGDLIIDKFEVSCLVGDEVVMTMDTTFGFFPPHSFDDQKGLPPSEFDQEFLDRSSDYSVDLTERPAEGRPAEWFREGSLSMPGRQLLMLDRVTGHWEEDGNSVWRAEKDIDPGDWYFKAHFYTDPVQPGSLGVEAILQLVQFHILHHGLAEGLDNPRLEPCLTDKETEWHYRGQVVPRDSKVTFLVRILDTRRIEGGLAVEAEGQLWVNELKIYHVPSIGMRVVES